jgi:membrane-associated phospholipid phosphatase
MKSFFVFLASLTLSFFGTILTAQDVVSIARNLQSQSVRWGVLWPTAANNVPASNGEHESGTSSLGENKEPNFFHDLVEGQKDIWTSPFRIQPHDLLWVGPLVGATAILISKDVEISDSIHPSQQTLDRSRNISYLGSAPVVAAFSGGVYVIGKISGNDRTATSGYLGLMALLQTSIVVEGLKAATNRTRPDEGENSGHFWSGGSSFPSGHAGDIWSLAGVLTTQYGHNPWISVGAYSIATAVSISRVTGKHHFSSDVLVGSAIGYLIGRMVVKQHSAHAKAASHLESLVPYFDPIRRTKGLEMSVSW